MRELSPPVSRATPRPHLRSTEYRLLDPRSQLTDDRLLDPEHALYPRAPRPSGRARPRRRCPAAPTSPSPSEPSPTSMPVLRSGTTTSPQLVLVKASRYMLIMGWQQRRRAYYGGRTRRKLNAVNRIPLIEPILIDASHPVPKSSPADLGDLIRAAAGRPAWLPLRRTGGSLCRNHSAC